MCTPKEYIWTPLPCQNRSKILASSTSHRFYPRRAWGCICLKRLCSKLCFRRICVLFLKSKRIQIKSYCQIAQATATQKNVQTSEMLKPKRFTTRILPWRSSTGCRRWLFQYLDTKWSSDGGVLLGGWAPSGCKCLISMVIVFVP